MSYQRKVPGIAEIARMADVSQSDVRRVFSALLLLVRKHSEVKVWRFGRFTARDFKSRDVVLGENEYTIKARRILHFNSSKLANRALSARRRSK